jgi:CubicO group peptidase (beta-lactamase class C family)
MSTLQQRVALGLFLATLLFAVCTVQAAAALPAGWNELTASFDSTMAQDHMVGGSIALVRDGKIVAHREFGLADRAAGTRVTVDTIFHWASNTKTLNAIGVMQLRDRGLLSLDQPITRYVPELRRVHNAYGSIDAITISMLLSHTAGFQDSTWPYKQGTAWEPFEPTRWEQLVAMMPYQEIGFAPGSRFSYSNPAWIYLAHMVEGLTDDPWEYYIQKNIFSPLGMTRSFFNTTPPNLTAQRSHSYGIRKDAAGNIVVDDYGAEFDPGVTIPNGGWNAPLADVATYIGFLTGANHGDAQTGRVYESVLKHSTLEEMWQPRATMDWESDSKSTPRPVQKMGLGFFLNERGGHRIVGHTGGQNGYSTFYYCDPATGLGVIGAINTGNGAREEGARSAFGILHEQALKVFE